MRQLLLLRHAKAASGDPGQSDHARPLTALGREAAASMRATIRELGLVPDVILVSSARRTLQTLEALSPWDETPIIEPMDGLYMATPAQLLGIIGGIAETVRGLMVIGHNPGLHELALRLAGVHGLSSNGNIGSPARLLAEGFPTGALAEFTVAKSWRDLGSAGGGASGRLVRFIRPRDLPEVAN
jgi:phosphohistidine phosphatase